MSRTTPYLYSTPSIAFVDSVYESEAVRLQESFAAVGLLCGLYGVFIILAVLSLYALNQRSRRTQPPTFVLCLTIVTLFASTTIYVVTAILPQQSTLLRQLINSGSELWEYSIDMDYPYQPAQSVKDYSALQACAGTATLTTNVILGDAIVCWRACTVWQNNRAVKAVCGMFLLATSILSVMGTNLGCHSPRTAYTYVNSGPTTWIRTISQDTTRLGIAACVLSLGTNLLATLLIAYKAWHSRRRLKGYFVAKIGGSQVKKLLTLLVESGVFYSAFLCILLAFQVCEYMLGNGSYTRTEDRFMAIGVILLNGALVPGIAIYPTFIIALVALNRSHLANGLSQHLESLPTPHLTLTLNQITTSPREHGLYGRQKYWLQMDKGWSAEVAQRRRASVRATTRNGRRKDRLQLTLLEPHSPGAQRKIRGRNEGYDCLFDFL